MSGGASLNTGIDGIYRRLTFHDHRFVIDDHGTGEKGIVLVKAGRRGVRVGCSWLSYEAIDELKRIADSTE